MPMELVTETATSSSSAAAAEAAVVSTAAVAEDWRAALPDDLKTHKGLEKFKAVDALAKSYLEIEKAYGAKLEGHVKLPLPDAQGKLNDAEVAAFRKATGVPEAPDGYQIQVSEDLADLVPSQAIGHFAPLFHKLNVPAPAAQAIVQGFAEYSQAQLATLDQGYRAKLGELKQEWGDATFSRRLALAKKVWETELPDDLKEVFDTTRLGSHPSLITFLAKYGEDLAESGHIDAQLTLGLPAADQLEKRKMEILADPAFYDDKEGAKNAVKHAALVKEYNEILAQLTPAPRR